MQQNAERIGWNELALIYFEKKCNNSEEEGVSKSAHIMCGAIPDRQLRHHWIERRYIRNCMQVISRLLYTQTSSRFTS